MPDSLIRPAGPAGRLARLGALAVLLFGMPVLAQEPASEDPAVFGDVIDVRVVNVEVVVTDGDGIRVTGLAPEDFELVVDGESVPIDYFTEIRGGEAVGGGAASGAVQSVPAAVPGEPVGTSYLVFVDDFFSIERDRNRVLEGLRDSLANLGPGDRMAVVSFDGSRVEMLSTWSGGGRDLNRAFSDAIARPTFGFQRLGERRAFEGAANAPARNPAGNARSFDLEAGERLYADQLERQVEKSISAAVATLRGFAQPPGRKVMLLLSGGWPYSIGHYVVNDPDRPLTGSRFADGQTLYAPLTDTANLLGYTVYPVDMPGLGGEFGGDVEQGGRTVQAFSGAVVPSAEDRFTENSLINSQERERIVEDAFQHVAQQTGGRALLNAQKLDALSEVVSDTRSYYWLGFSPSRKRDDATHEIRVQVNKPGLKVRSRGGFRDMSPAAERDMATQSALLFGDPASNSLIVELGEVEPAGRRFIEVPLRIVMPVGQLTALPTAEGHVMSLELRFAALDESDRESEIPSVPVKLTFPQAPPSNAAVPYDTRLRLRRQNQTLVVSLHDTAGERQLVSRVEVRP